MFEKMYHFEKKRQRNFEFDDSNRFQTVETGQQMAGKVRDTKKKQLEERSATN